MEKIKVMIVEDHAVVREGLRVLLKEANDMVVVGVAVDGVEAVAKANKLKPNVVLMDLSMPTMDGIEATRRIRLAAPCIQILILTSYFENETLARAMENGATGYMLKQCSAKYLTKGIREASRGHPYFSPLVAERLEALKPRPPSPQGHPGPTRKKLTQRERQTLQLVSQGYANKQVADVLKVSIKTVEKFRQSLMDKLGIHETAGLTRYVCAQESRHLLFPSLGPPAVD